MSAFVHDSRMLLLAMADEGLEATGAALAQFWRRLSRTGRLNRILRELETAGYATRSERGAPLDARVFRITEAGRALITGAVDPEERWRRAWDGQWRLVLFDVPQAHAAVRTRLRRKLRELRFGWLQNSVWISPDPLDELKRSFEPHEKSVESLVYLETRPAGGERDEELVLGAWDFAALAKSHAAYVQLLRQRPSRARQGDLNAWTTWLQAEKRAWDAVLRQDPLLPERLWPAGYAGRAVWQARKEALASCSEAFARELGSG